MSILALSAVLAALYVIFKAKGARALDMKSRNPSIVLATHGTTVPGDLKDLGFLEAQVKAAFPCYDIYLSFISDDIREVWRDRQADSNFKQFFPSVPEKLYRINNPLTTLALIQETGSRLVLVQPILMIDGPEYHDLFHIVDSLRQIKTFDRNNAPFPWIGLGAPAMGLGDGQKENLQRVANSLQAVFDEAKDLGAGVILVADLSSGINPGVYRKLAELLENNYDAQIIVALPEDRIGFKKALDDLEAKLPPPSTLIIAPLTLVMSEEVRLDITGPQPDSWANIVRERGYTATPRLKGLGNNMIFAEIFIETLKRLEEAVSRRYTD
jgi:cobalamin biosynthesis Co2+ chelatase CbiK